MQLHACLLLFIITTDKILASSHLHCGGNVILDQEPAGRISLTSPGRFTDTSTLDSVKQESEEPFQASVCTWMIDIPLGRTVLLKLERGSNISVRCVWNEQTRVLESGGTTLLSGCDRNKAALTWTRAGNSTNGVQLAYYVQEDGRNSSEDGSTRHPDPSRWSQTGTSFTSAAPVGQDVVRGTEEGRGRFYEGQEWSSGPQSVDQGLLLPTSPQHRQPVSGRADRETLPLPEEKLNNGADTSGAAHLTDRPMTAREGTRPYVVNAFSTDSESNPSDEIPHTQMTDAAGSSSSASPGTEAPKYTSTETPKHTDKHSSSFHPLTSSSPELPSRTIWEFVVPRGGAVSGTPGDKQPPSWRSLRSTDRLASDLTSITTTSDPLKSSSKPPQHESRGDTGPTSSSSQGPGSVQSSTTHITEPDAAVGTVEAASLDPNTSPSESFVSDVTAQTAAFEWFDKTAMTTPTNSPRSAESLTDSPFTSSPLQTQTSSTDAQTESTQRHFMTDNTASSSPDNTDKQTSGSTGSPPAPTAPLMVGVQHSTVTGVTIETYTLHPTHLDDNSLTDSPTSAPLLLSGSSTDSSTPSYSLQTHTVSPDSSQTALTSSGTDSTGHTVVADHKTTPAPSQTSPHTHNHLHLPASTDTSRTHEQSYSAATTAAPAPVLPLTTIKSDYGDEEVKVETVADFWLWTPSNTTAHNPTAGPPPLQTTPHPSQENHSTVTVSTLPSTWSSTNSPKFYIVPDQAAAIRVESIELLLQIVVEESRSALTAGLEEDTAVWVEPYLQKAPGFSRLLGVWSSGHAVQSLVEFQTREALQWLSMEGPSSLLEQTGLAQAVREGKTFRSSKITNITLGGLQGDVCDWLLQCPAGFKCVSQPGSSNYSCSSVCHSDYCHHHGICTHHPGQLPVCRCLVGEDFWFMGQRCDTRMTRARLVGACLAVLLIMVTLIGVLAFVAVRRYRAILIQAKVDQTRSSSQYGWRGSEMSMGDGVLDSGKASDLSVCSWPVEPIHWTPFPLLQQLASHRTPTVRVSRPRSYCEGMELVDLGKSWTA
ncbi:flocculation protein FLO11 isoform X2 [Stegastes partitus]|uniref:Flocculation protein FLO11-like n=1 Tax=Stegastes partitus TaxID=144197 RepID=A0A3B5A0D5_9TELE|nr:PREDICTED: flocculation protein FLO11-like isoform X2 [Stegastes partitus]